MVPTLNEAARIAKTVTHLSAAGCGEVIVADGGSTDGTRDVARDAGATRILEAAHPSRGGQLKLGCARATGDVILMHHADVRLPPGALAHITAAFADPTVAATAFQCRFDSSNRVLAACGWASRFETPLTTFGDQSIAVRASALASAGGVPDVPLLEDVILRKRLKKVGRIVKLPVPVTASARRFERCGVIRQQIRNSIILARFACGADPADLARAYRRTSRD
ncbi:MAG: TIGR04283 family arsenosugar biosynthesis glycosyltransferase [Pseudomonadota bacterium]